MTNFNTRMYGWYNLLFKHDFISLDHHQSCTPWFYKIPLIYRNHFQTVREPKKLYRDAIGWDLDPLSVPCCDKVRLMVQWGPSRNNYNTSNAFPSSRQNSLPSLKNIMVKNRLLIRRRQQWIPSQIYICVSIYEGF